MKTRSLLFSIAFLLTTTVTLAQYWSTNSLSGSTYRWGAVGIGISAPETQFHIGNTADATIRLEATNGSGRKWDILSSGGSGVVNSGHFGIVDVTNNALRLGIDMNGKVTAYGDFLGNGNIYSNGIIQVGSGTKITNNQICIEGNNDFYVNNASAGNGNVWLGKAWGGTVTALSNFYANNEIYSNGMIKVAGTLRLTNNQISMEDPGTALYVNVSANSNGNVVMGKPGTGTISVENAFNLKGYTGSGARFLQVEANGNVSPWTGSGANAGKVLFGDNTWKPFPFTINGTNIYTDGSTKFGVGTAEPITELDVNGGAQVQNGFRVGEGIYVGPENDYGLIRYIPGTETTPAVFRFGGGGTSNPRNPNPGSPYNPYLGGHGGGEHSPDPLPLMNCTNGYIQGAINVFDNVICIKKDATPINYGVIGNINMGHNGLNGFIETQGTNQAYPNAGDLMINAECNRNIYAFSNGSSFADGTDHVMSVAGRMNVTQNMQIGGGTSLTNFQNNSAMLYVNTPGDKATGIKVKHAGGADAGIRIIELSDSHNAFAVNKGGANDDGTERFSVKGDGKTQINTSNAQAFGIKNTNDSYESFVVNSDGKTEIKTTNTRAFSVFNASNSNNETFSIDKNGYTEINIHTPFTLPDQTNNVGRVFAIKDKVANKDIFVIKQNGKTYAREVEISLVASFPDYVFNQDYNLKSIPELDKYISSNKHLPGFEKGTYYEKNGINVNDMMLKQQEKIEELTLYIIQLEKRLQAIEKK